MISESKAVELLRLKMRQQYPRIRKFSVVKKPILLSHYGFVSAVWDDGKQAITLDQPYRVSTG